MNGKEIVDTCVAWDCKHRTGLEKAKLIHLSNQAKQDAWLDDVSVSVRSTNITTQGSEAAAAAVAVYVVLTVAAQRQRLMKLKTGCTSVETIILRQTSCS